MEVKKSHMEEQPHYARLGIEPINIMRANMSDVAFRGFLKGNILKYVLRDKGSDVHDAAKIEVYAKWLKESYDVDKKEV